MSVVYFTDRDLGLQFPQILQDAGLAVERHRDHFLPAASDEQWLAFVGGKAPYPELAKSFVATRSRIEAFLRKHEAPFIARVYRASPAELAKNASAPGHIVLWIGAQ